MPTFAKLSGILSVRMGWLALLLTFVLAQAPAVAAKRVALVIGNSAYEAVPRLANPARDARAIGESLQRLGFDRVIVKYDQDFAGMRRTLRDFSHLVAGAEVAVLFYAGHGMEVGGQNYLIPTDANLKAPGDVDFEAIPLASALGALDTANKLKLVILDACRNNPFAARMRAVGSKRSIGRGLTRVNPRGNDTLVAYAAKEGTEASDGEDEHSPFTKALLRHMETPGLEIRLLFGRVRDEVMTATGRTQEPFTYGSLGGEAIYLKPGSTSAGDPAAQAWAAVKDTTSKAVLETFIKNFPGTFYEALAKARLKEMQVAALPKPAEPGDDLGLAELAPLWTVEHELEPRIYGIGRAVELESGDIAVTVWTNSEQNGDDAAVLRIGRDGTWKWYRDLGRANWDSIGGLAATRDGGFIVVGGTVASEGAEAQGWVLKFDSRNQLEWEKTFGGPGWDDFNSVVELDDGGYAMIGRKRTRVGTEQKNWDAWLVRLDRNGRQLWEKIYGAKEDEYGGGLRLLNDGGFIFESNEQLMRADANGRVLWTKKFQNVSWISTVDVSSTGDMLITGSVSSNDGPSIYAPWIEAVDSNGRTLWTYRSKAGARSIFVSQAVELPSGRVFGIGSIEVAVTESDDKRHLPRFIMLNAQRKVVWKKVLRWKGSHRLDEILRTRDGGLIVLGSRTLWGDKSPNGKVFAFEIDTAHLSSGIAAK